MHMQRAAGRQRGRTRRSLAAFVGAGAMLLATGCWVQPTPGPVVSEASVSPNPVVAGSTFRFTLSATNVTYRIFAVGLTLTGPSGYELWSNGGCERATPPGFSSLEVEVDVACTIPEGAPNGTWTITARIINEAYSWIEEIVPFEVIDGSNDVDPPQVSLTIPPTAARGSSFDVTIRAVDEHGPVRIPVEPLFLRIEAAAGGYDQITCRPSSWTQVDATTFEYPTTCDVAADQRLGRYDTSGWRVYDRFDQSSRLELSIDVV